MWRGNGGTPCKNPRMYHDGDQRQNVLGRAGYTLAMLCCTAGTDKIMIVSVGLQENQQALGSDVTSYNNEIPSTTPFFLVAHLKDYVICSERIL
jgi:hypothetical protein